MKKSLIIGISIGRKESVKGGFSVWKIEFRVIKNRINTSPDKQSGVNWKKRRQELLRSPEKVQLLGVIPNDSFGPVFW